MQHLDTFYGYSVLLFFSGNLTFFTPNPGEMIQFDEHIFQMGWFNHQYVCFSIGKFPNISSHDVGNIPSFALITRGDMALLGMRHRTKKRAGNHLMVVMYP